MLVFLDLLEIAIKNEASDIFIIAGQPLSYKKGKTLYKIDDEKVMPDSAKKLIEEIYTLAQRDMSHLMQSGDDDFAISVPNMARLRMCAYKQRGSLAAVLRVVSFGIPDYKKMCIPDAVMELSKPQNGLVLVTGTAGSGKSTTLACIIDRINKTRSGHIITLEDPIEYLYRNDQSIVTQREIGLDTTDYVSGLRACLRQAPDVILVGEMRDHDTIRIAMTGAETGHLVFSTLHTVGVANTIDRIIDSFPPNQQQQIRIQLSMVLQTVVSQQLVPTVDGDVVPAFEIMHINPAIRNMIRESKSHLFTSGAREGLFSMDNSLFALYQEGKITEETALQYAFHPDLLEKRIKSNKGR